MKLSCWTVCTELYCDTELSLVISAMETERGEIFCQRFSLESIFMDPVTSNVIDIVGSGSVKQILMSDDSSQQY